MSRESDKRDIDPNATIQLDALDGVQLDEHDASAAAETNTVIARETPPPLPGAPAPTARRPVGKTLAYGAVFIALLAAAIAAGLTVGSRTRAKFAADPVTSAAVSTAPMTAPGSASARTLTLPTIEIKGP